MKYDVTAVRKQLMMCRAKIKKARGEYIDMMRKRFNALPKSQRMKFVAEMPERMRSLGMFAPSTYWGDITRAIIYRWYRADNPGKRWERGYERWTNWQQEQGINWDQLRREYGKARLERQIKGIEA